jgi:hypothetical protein
LQAEGEHDDRRAAENEPRHFDLPPFRPVLREPFAFFLPLELGERREDLRDVEATALLLFGLRAALRRRALRAW